MTPSCSSSTRCTWVLRYVRALAEMSGMKASTSRARADGSPDFAARTSASSVASGSSGRQPSRAELAERSGLSLDHVDALLATERAPRSLQEPVSGEEGEIGTFGELLVDPLAEDEYEHVLSAVEVDELRALLAGLSDRERQVLRMRYGVEGEELSLRDVGDRLGLSGERVRQIERRALAKLAAPAVAAA